MDKTTLWMMNHKVGEPNQTNEPNESEMAIC